MLRTTLLPALVITAACSTSSAPPDDAPLSGRDTFLMFSQAMNETRRINVSFPPGYSLHQDARYTVLYALDGGIDEDFPHLVDTVDESIREGVMEPIIVVGIENTERRRDMTGPTEAAEDRQIAPRVGGSGAFRRFIRDELIPEIGRRTRTTGKTAIIGESLAGLFVVETFFREPESFDIFIALDPSLWWNDGFLLKTSDALLQSLGSCNCVLYLTAAGKAGEGGIEFVEPLAASLRAHAPSDLVWHYMPIMDATHATIFRMAKRDILARLFPARERDGR